MSLTYWTSTALGIFHSTPADFSRHTYWKTLCLHENSHVEHSSIKRVTWAANRQWLIPADSFELPVMCISLECGRKLESLERTGTGRTGRLPRQRPRVWESNLRPPCCEVTVLTTVPPCHSWVIFFFLNYIGLQFMLIYTSHKISFLTMWGHTGFYIHLTRADKVVLTVFLWCHQRFLPVCFILRRE